MIEPLGFPHPNPLPEGEGTKNLPHKGVGEGDKYRIMDCFYPYPSAYGGVGGERLMGK
jgi:hypothetical protein